MSASTHFDRQGLFERGLWTFVECLQRGGSAVGEMRFALLARSVQGSPKLREDVGFVIDKEQAFRHQVFFAGTTGAVPTGARWRGVIGRWLKKVVPRSGSVSNQIFPVCFLTTML